MNKIAIIMIAFVLILALTPGGCSTTKTAATTTSQPPSTASSQTTSANSPIVTGSQTTSKLSEKQSGGILRLICNETPAGSLGIPENFGGLSSAFLSGVYQRLLTRNTSGSVVAELASSFAWSNNNLTLTIPLRKNVKFQDGTDFNADAAIWNLDERIASGIQGSSNIASCKKIDDYTIQIDLNKFENTWLESFAGAGNGAYLGIEISPTAVKTKGKDALNWAPFGLGTGPFQFKSYKTDEYVELERFDGYWGGKTYLDGIKWLFVPDVVSAQLSFESGAADGIWIIGGANQLLHDLLPKGYISDQFPGLSFVLVPSSGNSKSPWANQKVREAAEYAIDREGIVKTLLYGYPKAMYQNACSYQSPYDPNFAGRKYDPVKAKQLMVEAGYQTGFETNLYVAEQLSGNYMPAIQANLKAVGINASLQVISTGKWIDSETNGWDEGLVMSPQGAGPFGQFVQRYWIRPSAPNWSSGLYWTALYRPAEMDSLITAYLQEPTIEGQKSKGQALVKLMYDQSVAFPLWEGPDTYILGKNVHETKFGVTGNGGEFNYLGAWMSK